MDTRIDTTVTKQAGFSLIELLVVIAVLSVLAVGASLAATRAPGRTDDADRFARIFAQLRQLSVQGQQWRGLNIRPRGHQMAGRSDGQWLDSGRETRWRGQVTFATDGPIAGDNSPEIVFLPNGRTSAFSIRFGAGAGTLCQSDGWTGLICEAN